MKRISTASALFLALLLAGCAGKAPSVEESHQPGEPFPMSPAEARRFLQSSEATRVNWTISDQPSGRGEPVGQYRVVGNRTLEIIGKKTGRSYAFPLNDLSLRTATIALGTTTQIWLDRSWFMWASTSSLRSDELQQLRGAMLTLRGGAQGQYLTDPAEEAAFQEHARRYREAPVKPLLPEDVRRYKVQAEHAIASKRFDDATERYEQALRLAPWWPEGHFNRALLLGELGRHQEAIVEMKRYLALVPNAPDARAAQDKIYAWEGEVTRARESAPVSRPSRTPSVR